MDVGNFASLMRKTQSTILENGFLGKRLDELRHVSAALWLCTSDAKFVWCFLNKWNQDGSFFSLGLGRQHFPIHIWARFDLAFLEVRSLFTSLSSAKTENVFIFCVFRGWKDFSASFIYIHTLIVYQVLFMHLKWCRFVVIVGKVNQAISLPPYLFKCTDQRFVASPFCTFAFLVKGVQWSGVASHCSSLN